MESLNSVLGAFHHAYFVAAWWPFDELMRKVPFIPFVIAPATGTTILVGLLGCYLVQRLGPLRVPEVLRPWSILVRGYHWVKVWLHVPEEALLPAPAVVVTSEPEEEVVDAAKNFAANFARDFEHITACFTKAHQAVLNLPPGYVYRIPNGITYTPNISGKKPQGIREDYRIEIVGGDTVEFRMSLNEKAQLLIEKSDGAPDAITLHSALKVGQGLSQLKIFLDPHRT